MTVLLTDLHADLLCLILSHIRRLDHRHRPALACRDLAAALASPPCCGALWGEIAVPSRLVAGAGRARLPGAAALFRAVIRAAPHTRRLCVDATGCEDAGGAVCFSTPASHYALEEFCLTVTLGGGWDEAAVVLPLGRAARLRRLLINGVTVLEGPPPLVADGCVDAVHHRNWRWAAGAEAGDPHTKWYWCHTLDLIARHVRLAAEAEGGAGAVYLTRVDGLLWPCNGADGGRLEAFVRGFVGGLGGGVERLTVKAGLRGSGGAGVWVGAGDPEQDGADAALAALAGLVAGLPCLRDLAVDCTWGGPDRAVPLDLSGVSSPPRGLARLAVKVPCGGAGRVHLSPALRARLEALAVQAAGPWLGGPPECVRDGTSLARLARLAYGSCPAASGDSRTPINLAAWARPEFGLPALEELEVVGRAFTLDGPALKGWAEAVVAAHPRLGRLLLRQVPVDGGLCLAPFATCGGASAAAVRAAVVRGLPAAAASAGRALVVCVAPLGEAGTHPFAGDGIGGSDRAHIGLTYAAWRGW
jgi:hypothetical protein